MADVDSKKQPHIKLGLRVVRGRSWKWEDQDGGEGHVGTVVSIKKSPDLVSSQTIVDVQWDHGVRANYRTQDLRVFDNAQIGVKHSSVTCDECKASRIAGIRWKCSICYDYDLCNECYNTDKHDLRHAFHRIDTDSGERVDVPERYGSTKVDARGIFTDSTVERGPNWMYGSQDGGKGTRGIVVGIKGWKVGSERSGIDILWPSGKTNIYRLGYEGKVDLKCVIDSSGGFYYKDHLPELGLWTVSEGETNTKKVAFKKGDLVKISVDLEELKKLQVDHGGYVADMGLLIGKTGTVLRYLGNCVHIHFDGPRDFLALNPAALSKVNTFRIGDTVEIIADEAELKRLQTGHGEWIENMRTVLGKTGKVTKVYPDEDIRVHVEDILFTFNPACLKLISKAEETEEASSDDEGGGIERLLEVLGLNLQDMHAYLMKETSENNIENVKQFLAKHPEKVNETSGGRTALQVASLKGHLEIMKVLLDAGAVVDFPDEDDESTALHYSAHGEEPEAMRLLLERGADVNSLTKKAISPLHVAVHKENTECVGILIQHNCNVNLQDSDGDTPLHEAIRLDIVRIVSTLLTSPNLDLLKENNNGFNPLQYAALKGSDPCLEELLPKMKPYINNKMECGFGALHIAAANNHTTCAELLLSESNCDIDIRNLKNNGMTPLMLGVIEGYHKVVELLVSNGASLTLTDDDGDTALHVAVHWYRKQKQTKKVGNNEDSPILNIMPELVKRHLDENIFLAIACYLAEAGSDISAKNKAGKTPLEMLYSSKEKEVIQYYASKYSAQPISRFQTKVLEECIVCSDAPATLYFEPCGHMVACSDCGARMKKCIKCQTLISKKIDHGNTNNHNLPSAVQFQGKIGELEKRIKEFKEVQGCTVCLENRCTIVFQCGHSACENCSKSLKLCHICRKEIKQKIQMF